jgi:hypothetical protein
MEDVKNTLWKWAIQIAALANWGWELWGISVFGNQIAEKPSSELLPPQAVGLLIAAMMALASIFYFRLICMRKWAGWVKLTASSAHVYRAVAISEVGLAHWSAQLVLATAAILLCALLLKPKVWRGGF